MNEKKNPPETDAAAEVAARIAARRLEEATRRGTDTQLDDFWDLDMLVPKTRTAPRRAPGATDTAEISFGGQDTPHTAEAAATAIGDVPLNLNPEEGEVLVRHFVPPHTEPGGEGTLQVPERPVIAYDTEGSLVHRVAVYEWASRYHYYRDFCADAAKYLSREPQEEMPYTPFFSYVPQYSQMNREQLAFYLYWRREFRRGNIIKTDDSYIYLYVYEIINTAGYETDPKDGLRMLYRLFRTYGRQNARLARLLTEWIVDYSLIFRFPVPEKERAEPDFYRTYAATLKEFYISSPGGNTAGYADMLLRFCSSYDYKKSHFYTESNRAYFDRFLPGALAAVVAQYSEGTRLFASTGMRDSHMVRNAYEQALCSYRIRYRIEVDYASFSRSHEMRYLVSDILKYTENRLRAFLGIKSRLTVYSVTTDMKKCIDRYCDDHFPRRAAEVSARQKEEVPSYEKLYDLPEAPLSLTHAAEIELSSWETTRRLTEAFADEDSVTANEGISPSETSQAVEADRAAEPGSPETEGAETEAPLTKGEEHRHPLEALLGELYPFAEAAYRGDVTAERDHAARIGMLPDLIADRINELAADAFGDILLIDEGAGYTVIDEDRSMFESP